MMQYTKTTTTWTIDMNDLLVWNMIVNMVTSHSVRWGQRPVLWVVEKHRDFGYSKKPLLTLGPYRQFADADRDARDFFAAPEIPVRIQKFDPINNKHHAKLKYHL